MLTTSLLFTIFHPLLPILAVLQFYLEMAKLARERLRCRLGTRSPLIP